MDRKWKIYFNGKIEFLGKCFYKEKKQNFYDNKTWNTEITALEYF